MTVRVVVPYDAATPKTRLDAVLTPDERTAFANAMLSDVLDVVDAVGVDPEVLATAPVDVSVPVTVDDRDLTPAINDVLQDGELPMAVVMADLALATPSTIRTVLETSGDVVLVPGLGGGTNAVVVRHPEFRVDFHGASIRDHRRAAADIGASVTTVDSMRLATDIDVRNDLAEVLLHGGGRSREWVADRFRLQVTDGRVGVTRR